MAKQPKPKAEDYDYLVARLPARDNYFTITKTLRGAFCEEYQVQLTERIDDEGNRIVWCNCPGFLMQKYAKVDHKHVKLAIDFVDRGEMPNAVYKLEAKTNRLIWQG